MATRKPNAAPAADPLKPSITLLAKIGSALVHADEMLSPDGHTFDRDALKGLITDPEVQAWIDAMNKMALLPKKRRG